MALEKQGKFSRKLRERLVGKQENSSVTYKDSRMGVWGPAATALLAAVLASLIGQQINAAVETSKVVRAKLEESYFRTLNLPRYAEMLNVIAVSPIQEVSAERSMLEYNAALKLYSDEVSHLVAVADLYEEDVSGDAEGLRNCSKKFFENTANYFITAHRLRAQNLTNTPFSPSQLNDLVAIRMECEAATTQLRKTIATAMKRHLSHWPI